MDDAEIAFSCNIADFFKFICKGQLHVRVYSFKLCLKLAFSIFLSRNLGLYLTRYHTFFIMGIIIGIGSFTAYITFLGESCIRKIYIGQDFILVFLELFI